MPHRANPPGEGARTRLTWAMILNLGIVAVEVAGGLLSGSLSRWSDALHNASDAISLLISLMAANLSRQGSTEARTFGSRRAEILAAQVNAALLLAVSCFLYKAVWDRGRHPAALHATWMAVSAAVAMAANIGAALLLKRGAQANLNVRSSYAHLIIDVLASFSVLSGGVLVARFPWFWLDSLLTLAIGAFATVQGWSLLSRTTQILMQQAPPGLDLQRVRRRVEAVPGVADIHHVHFWQMTERDLHVEAHINVSRDMAISECVVLKGRLEALLSEEFGVSHATFQFEFGRENQPLVVDA